MIKTAVVDPAGRFVLLVRLLRVAPQIMCSKSAYSSSTTKNFVAVRIYVFLETEKKVLYSRNCSKLALLILCS